MGFKVSLEENFNQIKTRKIIRTDLIKVLAYFVKKCVSIRSKKIFECEILTTHNKIVENRKENKSPEDLLVFGHYFTSNFCPNFLKKLQTQTVST
jgi:hypothetical protein